MNPKMLIFILPKSFYVLELPASLPKSVQTNKIIIDKLYKLALQDYVPGYTSWASRVKKFLKYLLYTREKC